MKSWKKLSSKVIFKHRRLTLLEDDVILPTGEKIKYLRYKKKLGGVTIICQKEEKILIQKEYSYPVNDVLIQFPGGGIKDGETPVKAAKRELEEESGYTGKFKSIGWYYVDNRRTDTKMYVVVATSLREKRLLRNDVEEKIVSEWVDIKDLDTKIKNNRIHNYSLLSAWAIYKNKED